MEDSSPFVAEYVVLMTIHDVCHDVPDAFPGNLPDCHPGI